VKPAFQERTDPNHVSLAATISFSGETLTPMILTAAEPNFQDPKMAELARIYGCLPPRHSETILLTHSDGHEQSNPANLLDHGQLRVPQEGSSVAYVRRSERQGDLASAAFSSLSATIGFSHVRAGEDQIPGSARNQNTIQMAVKKSCAFIEHGMTVLIDRL
jgi:hypothetical protein